MKVLDGINVYTNVFWAATKNNQFLLRFTLVVYKLHIFFSPSSFLLNSFFGPNEFLFSLTYMLSWCLRIGRKFTTCHYLSLKCNFLIFDCNHLRNLCACKHILNAHIWGILVIGIGCTGDH